MSRIRGTKEEIISKKSQYGMWLGLPEEAREPSEQRELAKQLGVDITTLPKWKNDPLVIQAKENALKLFYKSGTKVALFLKSVEDGLRDGRPQTQRLYAEMAGLLEGREKKTAGPLDIKVTYKTE